MIDELDVLERYLAETPHPTSEALGSIRQQLTLVMADPTAHEGRPRLPRHRVIPLQRVALAAAVLVVIVAISVPLLASTSRRTIPPLKAPSWHLAGDIAQPNWKIEGSDGSGSYELECPSAEDCYASEPSIPPSGQGLPTGIMEVSHDGGRTWEVGLSAPAVDLYGLTCPSADTCMITGEDFASGSMEVTLYRTTNGGASWASWPIGQSTGSGPMSCASAQDCVASLSTAAPGGQGSADVAAVTSDGGVQWTIVSFPGSFRDYGLSCVGRHCVAVGQSPPNYELTPGQHGDGTVIYSDDGGLTWSTGSAPSTDTIEALTCADATHCLAVEQVLPNPAGRGTGEFLDTIISTDDGGETWTATMGDEPDQWLIGSLSCPTALECWISGIVHAPAETIPQVVSGKSTAPFIKETDDGGQSWMTVPLPDVDGIPIRQVGVVSCADAAACFAVVQDPTSTGTAPSTGLTQRQLVLSTATAAR
ncbi:MAG TPA: hypothetical protein VGG38_20890 [Acidimicrobiales bacterium]